MGAGIKALTGKMDKYNEEIAEMQKEVDKLRVDLGISDAAGEESYSIIEPEIVRRYESGLIDARGFTHQCPHYLMGLKLQSLGGTAGFHIDGLPRRPVGCLDP